MTVSLSTLLVPSKSVETEFPGLPGFKLQVRFLSRETLSSLRKKSTKTVFKGRNTVETTDDDLFLKLYVEAVITGWTGLTYGYLEQLAPVELGDEDRNKELEYSAENAVYLMKASLSFDNFITEFTGELGNFSKRK